MNRIIIIGNGFDKAHGLATGYTDFINWYWEQVVQIFQDFLDRGIRNSPIYSDGFITFKFFIIQGDNLKSPGSSVPNVFTPNEKLNELVTNFNSRNFNKYRAEPILTNDFFKRISLKQYLLNWVDIENEYYESLKEIMLIQNLIARNRSIQKLNSEFDAVKNLLRVYLESLTKDGVREYMPCIKKEMESLLMDKDFPSILKHGDFASRSDYLPETTLFLNFNYTNTAKSLYFNELNHSRTKYDIINIHGELNNPLNPVVFGYGDELDNRYVEVERLLNNDFLMNMKSFNYLMTGNYRRLMAFVEADQYQVFIMGHSCGNSDLTLLNSIFEHKNCCSIKVYYHQIDENKDNYQDLVMNISRNFNDKVRMRNVVVNKTLCRPLVPFQKKNER